MRSAFKKIGLVFLLIAMGSGMAAAQEKTVVPVVHKQGDIQYTSGGNTLAEKSAMHNACRMGNFNLKIVFKAAARRYLDDMKIVIEDTAGKAVVATASQGPWFFAKLPEGEYVIKASLEGKNHSKKVLVGKEMKTLEFQWQAKSIN